MKKIVVTGGCGFIGSHFVRYALKTFKDCTVVNFDKLTYSGNLNNVRDLHGNRFYIFVKGDINDRILVESAAEEADAIINFAAETHVDRSIEEAGVFLATNIVGTHTLLEVVRTLKIPVFLHVSTDEVYGSMKRGSAGEDAPLRPSNPYSASKAAADLLALSYYVTHRAPVRIVRPSNNFGPYQFLEKVTPLFITNLIEGKTLPLYGKGQNIRRWIFVEDTCRAIALVLEKGEDGRIYNVGGEKELRNLDLARAILKRFGAKESQIHYVEDRPGHDFRYALKSDRIKKLGFRPEYSFEKALDLTVQWYRERTDWWASLKADKFTVKK